MEWQVRRRWLTRGFSRSWKQRGKTAAEMLATGGTGDSFTAVDDASGLVLLGLVIAAVLVVVPLFLFGLELIVLGWVLASGVIGRLVLRRPWVIEARVTGGPGPALQWRARGWRESNRLVDEIASDLAAGRELPAPRTGERAQPG